MTGDPNPISGAIPKARIKYTLTRVDLLWATLHHVLRNRILIAFLFIASTFVGLLDLRQPEMALRPLVFKAFFLVFFDVIFLSVVSFIVALVLGLTILARKYRGVLCEHTLEVTDGGLVEHTDVNQTVYSWASFHKVLRSQRYLHLYVTDVLVHTVPLRSFESEDQLREFLHEIERHSRTN